MPTVRRAPEADAAAIAVVAARALREGLAGILPGERMPSDDPRWVEDRLRDEDVEVAVAEANGEVSGFAIFGATRDTDVPDSVAEIRVLHVDPDRWRSGLGRALVDHALDRLLAAGYEEATLWSAAANRRAGAFYEAVGFARDGAEQSREQFGNVPEVRYRIALAA